jgi:flagellar hook-length control protein FliK
LEEAEAAKKRKKAPDAALVANQIPNSGYIQADPCLDVTQDPVQLESSETAQSPTDEDQVGRPVPQKTTADSSNKAALVDANPPNPEKELPKTESISKKTSDEKAVAPEPKEVPPAHEKTENSRHAAHFIQPPLQDSKESTRGMKAAAKEDEMVSLATFEDAQSALAPKADGEPTVTSSNHLSVMANISERGAIKFLEGGSSGSSSQDLASGVPFSIPTITNSTTHGSASSQAASVLKTLGAEIEKFQQTGQSQIQLELPVGDKEIVKIRLHLRAGEIHSTFITQSPELRDALQKAWPDFTATHKAQGVLFGDSQFQDSFARQQDATSDQERQPQYEQNADPVVSKQTPPRKTQALSKSSQSQSSGTMNLWA